MQEMKLNMDELTEVEKQFVAAACADPEAPSGLFDMHDRKGWPNIREKMRRTAYHEAGHFAARCFTQLELSHVLTLSIIPKNGSVGRMISERPFAEQMLPSYPPFLQRSNGRMLLLENLAGMGAETILVQSEGWESILDYWQYNYCDEEEEGTDMFRAIRIAKIMVQPHMPVNRILKLADKWTLEMLRMPAIWNAVETIAGKLIEQGEIANVNKELSAIIYGSNFPSIFCFTKWKRRFLKCEVDIIKV